VEQSGAVSRAGVAENDGAGGRGARTVRGLQKEFFCALEAVFLSLTLCSQSHALRMMLRSQSLKDVFHATVIRKLTYYASAWHKSA